MPQKNSDTVDTIAVIDKTLSNVIGSSTILKKILIRICKEISEGHLATMATPITLPFQPKWNSEHFVPKSSLLYTKRKLGG